MIRGALLGLIALGFVPVASANENLSCFGAGSFFGSLAGLADGKKGPLDIQKLSRTLPNASFENRGEPGSERQRLTSVLKNQMVPQVGGTVRSSDVRIVANLAYENGRLESFDQTQYEVGASGGVISSNQTTYDWAGGKCRPTRIVVRDRMQLGDKRGVVFDAKLCEVLKAEGVNASAAEACVANAKKALAAVVKYDQALRAATGDKELLVSMNPFQPGGIVATSAMVDNTVGLTLMQSCAAFEATGAAVKKASGRAGADAGVGADAGNSSAR
ncbi:MAG: hypothetical protein EOP11_12370 [Proteobacteria bacterium]|nr:MAG: hypothetical protein EOP11_12370 [Pseudomonadota bacterium]